MMGCFRRGYGGDVGAVVWVVARCATGPHPNPLPPSGRGDALLWVRGLLRVVVLWE